MTIQKIMGRIVRFLKTWFLFDIFLGLLTTGLHVFKKGSTSQFPQETIPVSSRFRGLHALRRYQDGKERCIACKLCEAVCPAIAIKIESDIDHDGTRRAQVYNIDLFKCIFCGLCEEVCPVQAIVLTRVLHYHFEKRGDAILTKAVLLDIGDRYESIIAQDRAEHTPVSPWSPNTFQSLEEREG